MIPRELPTWPETLPDVDPSAAPEWLRPVVDAAFDPAYVRTLAVRRTTEPPRAAVLVVFAGDSRDDASVVITHRSPSLRSHSGQMAFPGGRIEPGDRDSVHTALREAWEEIGLDPCVVTPLAVVPAMAVRRSGYPVQPVLAYQHSECEVWPASIAETDDVLRVRVDELVDPSHRMMVRVGRWVGPAFRVRGYVVWGFTAGILNGLIRAAGWEEPWDASHAVDVKRAVTSSRNNEIQM